MARFLPLLSRLQTPVAVALVLALVADLWLGLGLPEYVLAAMALGAGALGVERPSEVAGRIAAALPPASSIAPRRGAPAPADETPRGAA